MTYNLRSLFFTIFFSLALIPATEAELVDAVVATVDKEAILYSEIMAEIESEIDNIRQSVTSQKERDRLSREVLRIAIEEAIDSKILVREAKRYSIEISDEQVERDVDVIRKNFETEEEFINQLQAFGESLSDFRERSRKKIMAQSLAYSRVTEFEDEVVVSDQAIAQYHQDHKDEFEIPEKILVRQIFIRVKQNPEERAIARARLELLREELEAGTDFAELAKIHSQAIGAEDGGIIGWQVKGDLQQPLEEAAFSLGNGEYSEVVETLGGLHIVKVDDHEQTTTDALEDVRLDIEEYLRAIEAQEKYKIWLNDLRKRSRVRIFLN